MPLNSELKLYDHLLQFPLFQGMSQGELMQLAGNTRLGFLKLPAGRQVIADGDSCDHLYLLISGTITIETQSDDHTYRMTEWISAPWLVQPEALFGLSTRHSQLVRTESDTHFITISKDEVLRLLDDFLIFRLNLLNLLSTQSQRRSRRNGSGRLSGRLRVRSLYRRRRTQRRFSQGRLSDGPHVVGQHRTSEHVHHGSAGDDSLLHAVLRGLSGGKHA